MPAFSATTGIEGAGAAEGEHHRVLGDLGEAVQLDGNLVLVGVLHLQQRIVEADAQGWAMDRLTAVAARSRSRPMPPPKKDLGSKSRTAGWRR
jgi:hypothetical protein